MKQSNLSQKSKESKSDIYLNSCFDEIRNENYDETFQATEAWLRSAGTNSINSKSKKTERIFINMKNYLSANKFKLVYTFLILAFVVAACNYPVTQQETAADVMKWTVSKDNTDAISKIENAAWFKNGEYNINEDGNYLTYSLVIPKESHASISEYEKELTAMGVNQINLIPLNETVKRPVYSALLNDLFKIDINASNMSDAELNGEINAQLKKAGIENATVDFEKGTDGKRKLKVIVPPDQIPHDGGFDMTVKDGDKITKMKELKRTGSQDNDKFKGKSDEEIRNMVRQDLNMPDLKDDEIEIMKQRDSVKIKINRKDEKGELEMENIVK